MKRTAYILIGVQLVDAIGLGLLLPVLPYFVQKFGASVVEVTQLVALYALANMICSSGFGRISDRTGRKPLVLFSTAGTCLAYLAYLSVDALALIFLIRGVSGVLAAKSGVVTAWMIDAVEPDQRGRYLGLLGSMNGIGMLLGPMLASLMVVISGDTYRWVFIGGVVLSVLATLGVLMIHDDSSEQNRGEQKVQAVGPPYGDLLFLNFAIFLAFSVVLSTSAIYMQARFNWDVQQAGLAIGVMTGSLALARAFIAHKLLARLGNESGTLITGLIMAVCLTMAGLSESPLLFMIFYCVSAAAYAIAAIGVILQLSDRLPVQTRGLGMGRLSAFASGAIVFGAATHGYLFEVFSPAAPFKLYGILVFLCVITWFLSQRRRRMHE